MPIYAQARHRTQKPVGATPCQFDSDLRPAYKALVTVVFGDRNPAQAQATTSLSRNGWYFSKTFFLAIMSGGCCCYSGYRTGLATWPKLQGFYAAPVLPGPRPISGTIMPVLPNSLRSNAARSRILGVPDIGRMNRRAIRGPFLLNPSVHGGFDVWGRRKWFTGTRRSCDHR